jgi:hypothetical protein
MSRQRAATAAAFLRRIPQLADMALLAAAGEYAGVPTGAGGVSAAASEGIVQRRFTRGNAHGWAPLSPAYAEWKARRFGSEPILVRTGALRRSLSAARVLRLGRGRVRVVFRVPDYAEHHHRGGGRLPRRSPVEPSADDRAAVRAAARRHFDAIVRRFAAQAGVRVR